MSQGPALALASKDDEEKHPDDDESYIEYQNESPIFYPKERTDLDKTIYAYLDENNMLSLEGHCDEESFAMSSYGGIFSDLNDSDEKLNDISALHKFIYDEIITNPRVGARYLSYVEKIPHNAKLWFSSYKETSRRTPMWELIQRQSVHTISQIHKYPNNIDSRLKEAIGYGANKKPKMPTAKDERPFVKSMRMATVNCDCILAGLHLKKCGYNPVVLNLANGTAPAAATGPFSEGGTQEENLFKRSTYYLSLWPHRSAKIDHHPYADYASSGAQKEPFYPLHDHFGAVYSPNVYVFRSAQSSGYAYLPLDQRTVLGFIAAQAPVNYTGSDKITGTMREIFVNKIRTIYGVAYENGHDAVVLGALGCGAFMCPPGDVAQICLDVLKSEFNGCFARVVCAILWDHNSAPNLVQQFAKRFPMDSGKQSGIFVSLDNKKRSQPMSAQ